MRDEGRGMRDEERGDKCRQGDGETRRQGEDFQFDYLEHERDVLRQTLEELP